MIEIEFAFLCDAASESAGKLYALGIGIEQLQAAQLPARPNRLTVAARFAFEDGDAGTTPFAIRLVDADGHPLMRPVEGQLHLNVPAGRTAAKANLLIDLVQPEFRSYGPHEVTVAVGGQTLVTLPLEVVEPGGRVGS